MRDVVLAVDLGTGSLRAGAVTAHGRLVAAASAALDGAAPDPASTVDPEIWWRALARTLSRTLAQLPRSTRVAAVCIAAVTRSQVLLDRSGRPLAAALPFGDRRAADVAALAGRYFRSDNPADAITAFHPLARLAWFARERRSLFERVAALVEPKDFLNLRLTGVLAADSVTYSRFDALRRPTRPLPDWLARCIALLALPRIAPWQMLGRIATAAAPFRRLAGIPVFSGSMDAWASAVGAGAVRVGDGYDIAGTSEVAGLVTRERAAAHGLVSLVWSEKLHQIGGPTQAGADCAAWCHRTFRVTGSLAAAIERCAGMLPNDDRPLFVPYLAGERAPIWREDVRGAFHGLARGQRADDFMASALEGVSLAVREIMRSAAAAAGVALREVRVAGGGARSPAWCQMKADVLGVPVARTSQPETGLIGAAMAAAVGLGWHRDLAAAADAMCRVERVFEPRAQFGDLYSRRAERYRFASAHAVTTADAARRAASDGHGIPARQRDAHA